MSDQAIDWTMLQDHKKLHRAGFIALVAATFSGSRVRNRAEDFKVALSMWTLWSDCSDGTP